MLSNISKQVKMNWQVERQIEDINDKCKFELDKLGMMWLCPEKNYK